MKSEMVTDLGAEDRDKFLDLQDLKLPQYDSAIFKKNKLVNPYNFEYPSLKKLKKVLESTKKKVPQNR